MKSGKMMLPAMMNRLHTRFLELPRVGQLVNNHAHNLNHKKRPHAAHNEKLTMAMPTQAETSAEVDADSCRYDAKPAVARVTIIDAKPTFRVTVTTFCFIAWRSSWALRTLGCVSEISLESQVQ